jgi:hypothetical protein
MRTKKLIAVNDFCINHKVEVSFVSSLQQTGLIKITTIEETEFLEAKQLNQLEKIVRFYYELGINLEGIESITYLLQRINSMQDEITALRNRLRFYESNE